MIPREQDDVQRRDAEQARVLAREDRLKRAREEQATTTDSRPPVNPMASAPWYVQLALNSPSALVIVVLLGQATGWIPSVAQRQTDAIVALDGRITAHTVAADIMASRVTNALRVMCENAAKDDVGRTNCRLIQ